MLSENWKKTLIDELLSSSIGELLQKSMGTVKSVQEHLFALMDSEDSLQLKLLEVGTVFQLFLIRTLASGKRPRELGKDDWKDIAEKVSQFAVLNDELSYSEFVFLAYASYIDSSVRLLCGLRASKETDGIKELSDMIRSRTEQFHGGELSEPNYIEDCLWLSLEAMIKLLAFFLSSALTPFLGRDRARLTEAVSQLAFEYGRCVLFSKEQALLNEYLQNQRSLDERLRQKYDDYLAELQENSDRFQGLLENAFSSELHDLLLRSAELARAAGVREEELLTSVEDVDEFFLA